MASPRSNRRRRNRTPRNRAPTLGEVRESIIDRLICPGVIFLATLVVFSPVIGNGFVSWDDDKTLLDNVHYRGLGWSRLEWMFTTFHLGHYQPLSWVTFALDYLVWGMNPLGYHLTNLLLHSVNAVLFYFLARRLLSLAYSLSAGSEELALRAAACFAALFFAIHPLRVESVAWATQRRDVLSGFFILCTILCYLRAAEKPDGTRPRRWWLLGAVAVYALSLLSKATGVGLSLILVVLDIYPLRRIGGQRGWWNKAARRVWWEKVPFLMLGVAAGVVAPLAQYQIGAMRPLERYGILPRFLQVLFGLAFYLWKTVVPLDLSPLYQIPVTIDPSIPAFIVSGASVLSLVTITIMLRRRWPAGLAVWACYLIFLAPVSGLVQSGPQLVADRYSYMACLGWAVLAGGGLFYLWRRWENRRDGQQVLVTSVVLLLVLLSGLAVLTRKQTQVWRDSETLWRYIVQIDPLSSIAHNNMGNILLARDQSEEAIEHYRRALEIDPTYAAAYFDLATALNLIGQPQAALAQFQAGLRIEPKNAKARYYLGVVYARLGEIDKAIDQFRESLNLAPDQSAVHFNWGAALAMKGDLDNAVEQFRQAIAIRPDYAEAHHTLGRVLAAQGRLQDATREFEQAVRLQPQSAEAHLSLSQALTELGKTEEGIQHYAEAMRILSTRR